MYNVDISVYKFQKPSILDDYLRFLSKILKLIWNLIHSLKVSSIILQNVFSHCSKVFKAMWMYIYKPIIIKERYKSL